MEEVVKTEKVSKTFYVGDSPVHALVDANLSVFPCDFVIIFGPSGSGKSTLLHTIIGLEKPNAGRVYVRGVDIYALSDDERAEFRAKRIGMVYQQPIWLRALSVFENVYLPAVVAGMNESSAKERAQHLLEEFGLWKLAKHRPMEISGGQQQMIGLARALINNPWLLILDEPTGNLDSKTGYLIFQRLREINKKSKRTIILVTHNPAFLVFANRIVYLKDGKIDRIAKGPLTHQPQEAMRVLLG